VAAANHGAQQSPGGYGGQQGGGYRGQQAPGGAWPTEPAGPYGPYGPSMPDHQMRAPARRRRGRIAAVIVAVAAVRGSGRCRRARGSITAPRHLAGPPPTAPASNVAVAASRPHGLALAPRQARRRTAISNLLTSGATSSTVLTNAVDKVQACTNLPQNVQQIQQVRDQPPDRIQPSPGTVNRRAAHGALLKSDLTKALFYSLTADSDYLAWAEQQESNCQAGSQIEARRLLPTARQSTYKTLFRQTYGIRPRPVRLPGERSVSSM